MRDLQVRRIDRLAAIGQHVHIDEARPPFHFAQAAHFIFDRKAASQKLMRGHVGCHRRRRIDEPVLLENSPRLRAIEPRRRHQSDHAVAAQQIDRARDVLGFIADVGPNADQRVVRPPRRRLSLSHT